MLTSGSRAGFRRGSGLILKAALRTILIARSIPSFARRAIHLARSPAIVVIPTGPPRDEKRKAENVHPTMHSHSLYTTLPLRTPAIQPDMKLRATLVVCFSCLTAPSANHGVAYYPLPLLHNIPHGLHVVLVLLCSVSISSSRVHVPSLSRALTFVCFLHTISKAL